MTGSQISPCPGGCFATCGKRRCRFSLAPKMKQRRTGGKNEDVHSDFRNGGGCLVARPELSISLIPLTHLLCAGADLDGIGNQPSGFLPGDCDDIFKSQRNLSKQRV